MSKLSTRCLDLADAWNSRSSIVFAAFAVLVAGCASRVLAVAADAIAARIPVGDRLGERARRPPQMAPSHLCSVLS